jgi:Flp pilus assembly secretin CpaC
MLRFGFIPSSVGILCSVLAVGAKGSEPQVPLQLPVSVTAGHHAVVSVPSGSRSASVADAHVATAQLVSDSEVLLTGVTRGKTTLLVRSGDQIETTYAVTVDATPTPPVDSAVETVQIGVGHQKTFLVPDVRRVAVGDPKVADVTVVDGKEVLLTGITAGRTSLLIWRANDARMSYAIAVEEKPLEESAAEIRALLEMMEGVRLRIIGSRIYLDGDPEPVDVPLVKRVCELYQPTLVCL